MRFNHAITQVLKRKRHVYGQHLSLRHAVTASLCIIPLNYHTLWSHLCRTYGLPERLVDASDQGIGQESLDQAARWLKREHAFWRKRFVQMQNVRRIEKAAGRRSIRSSSLAVKICHPEFGESYRLDIRMLAPERWSLTLGDRGTDHQAGDTP